MVVENKTSHLNCLNLSIFCQIQCHLVKPCSPRFPILLSTQDVEQCVDANFGLGVDKTSVFLLERYEGLFY